MTETLTLRRLNRATLARQLLLERQALPVPEAVERLGGMQAQEARHPFGGLWTRLAGFEREHLHAALHDRSVVRATLMRGTLHLATARDYGPFRAPLAEDLATQAERILGDRAAGLEPERVLPVARALLDEAPRTFTELRGLLQAEFPDVHERALGFTVRMGMALVMVPTEDRWAFPADARFTPADTWLGQPLTPDPSPEALVLRHLAAFGPATVADVQAWSGLKGLKAVLKDLRPRLAVFADERGRELFDLPDAPRPPEDTPAPARLLPEFDSLVLAHQDRSRLVDDEHRARVVTKNLRVRATFLWDGRVAGTWDVERKGRTATLRLRPFEPRPPKAFDALAAEAHGMLAFMEPDGTDQAVELGEPV